MARPRKDISENWYDIFYAMPVGEQAIVLRILQEHHRLTLRAKRTPEPKIEKPAAIVDGAGAGP